MGVSAERKLGAAAHIAVIAVADFDHHVAENQVGNPGDHPLKQVVVIELAGHPVLALWVAISPHRKVAATAISRLAFVTGTAFSALTGLSFVVNITTFGS